MTSEELNSYHYSRPKLAQLLADLQLNKVYYRAEGNFLFYKDEEGKEVKVLDFIGGYGAALLGHYHPEIQNYAIDLLQNKVPFHSQLSEKYHTGLLAKFISDEIEKSSAKKYITTFSNSGAEAVEGAIKHAQYAFHQKRKKYMKQLQQQLNMIHHHYSKNNFNFSEEFNGQHFHACNEYSKAVLNFASSHFEQYSPVILSAQKAYHGKTAGALKLTHNAKFKDDFFIAHSEKDHTLFFECNEQDVRQKMNSLLHSLPFPSLSIEGKIEITWKDFLFCGALIIEPVQGEGGVRKIDKQFLSFLRELTLQAQVPLIFDEIQCGCYRTGSLLYAQQIGVYADYFLLSKALGGSLSKIAALVIDKEKYFDDFGFLHTSTFADDEFSSAVALKSLNLLKDKSSSILSLGGLMQNKLQELALQFPFVIKEIRGTGLMWGVEFMSLNLSNNYSFQMFSRSGYLNYLFSSYLLHHF